MKKQNFLLILLLLTFGMSLSAQNVVKGTVKSDDEPDGLVGASVLVKGTTQGTITDVNGNFELNADPKTAVLEVSFTGFLTQTITLNGKSSVIINLSKDARLLEEVIVTTFGTAKRSSFTGAAKQINADDIKDRPVTNIIQALSGAAAGIQTTAGSGQPGTAPTVRIRGFGSISSSNDPLYVVDGVPYSASTANLNSDDIESMTVLKDAASTALYGARAANGVVMITTKKGSKNKSSINVRYTKGVNTRALPEYDRIGTADYYPVMWESYRNSLAYRATNPLTLAAANTDASAKIGGLLAYNVYNVPATDLVSTEGKLNPNAQLIYQADDLNWEKPLMRQGNRDELNVNFSGGSDKTDYFLSFSYLDDKGFLIRSDYNRYTARLNVNSQLKSWLKTGANISTTITKSNQADAGTNTAFVNPFFFSRNMGPIYPVYALDPANPGQFLLRNDGQRRYDYGNLTSIGLPSRPQYGGRHAIAETQLNQNFFRRNVMGGRGYAEFSFLKDFKFTANGGVDITNLNNNTFGNPEIGDGAPAGRATSEFVNVTSYNLSQLLNYTKSFGNHNVSALAGHENYQEFENNLTGSRSQQILEGNIELINFTTTTNLNSLFDKRRVEGYFSRLNYDFNEKYFVSLSARRDGSSKFYKDNRWGTFYSASAAWRLDQEDFIKSIPAISTLKIRSSYGQTGNDGGISRYAWQPLFELGWNNATEAGILQSSLGNKKLEWESSNASDVALEFGLFKDRISGTIEYFNRQSTNLIFDVPLPLSAGVLTETRNIGSMYNRGVEVELHLEPIKTKDFSWTLDVNATKLKNKITKMPEQNPEIIDGTKKLKEGSSLYDYWLREYMGVNPANGEAWYRAASFIATNSFITENKDTVTNNVNNARYRYNGTSIPKMTGGISTAVKYKGVTLSALVVYQIGGKVYDASYAGLMGSGGYGSAKHIDILNRWQTPGQVTNVPRMDNGRTADFDAASDRWLIDGSYLNVRTVTLSYQLPKSLLSKAKIQNAQIYVSGENFFISSKRKGMNVQQGFNGVTGNVFSSAKNLVSGISLTF